MSRIGKLPINIPNDLKVKINENSLIFKNERGEKQYNLSEGIKAEIENSILRLSIKNIEQIKDKKSLSVKIGMERSNINNIIFGMKQPFKISLEINGVGFKASVDKGTLVLTLGYSHEIFYALPDNVFASFEKPNIINIEGEDKIITGQVASEIINFRRHEPYKGKGIKIKGKVMLRKEGKKK